MTRLMRRSVASRYRWRVGALAAVWTLAAAGVGTARAAVSAPSVSAATAPVALAGSQAAAAHDKWQMLSDYCVKCHNATDWAGSVAFDAMQPESIPQDAKVWEEAVTKLQGRLMPPPGEKQPAQATLDGFVAWMQTNLDTAAAAHPDPGYVTLHRLNRTEYARSVEEMLGVKVDVTTLLPKDTMSDGFDDIANVLKVSPTFLDQYITAAAAVAALAVGNPQAHKSITILRAPRESQAAHIDGLPLGTHGMLVHHDFPADGQYEFDLGNGRSGPGGFPTAQESPSTTLLLIDGKTVFEQSAGGGGVAPKRTDAPRAEAAPKEPRKRAPAILVQVSAGPHDIAIAFVQHGVPESDDWLEPLSPAAGTERLERATGLQIVGPFNPTGVSDTPSRQKVFLCHPANAAEELPCATQIIGHVQRIAYRRPVSDADMAPALRFYQEGREGATFDAGIENALVAILSSPKFLYRMERTPANLVAGASYRISDLELASRVSFFLWSEGPDEKLLSLAVANQLHEPQVLATQVQRMLGDPRAGSLVTNFAFQWLKVDDMDRVNPDSAEYPAFDEDLRHAFKKEMELFLTSVLLRDQDVRELLTANYTFVNGRLAQHYGVPNVLGSDFRQVSLVDSRRWGLLGKGAILMGTSYANRTAPVLRGAWVLEAITGAPPHAPPPAIPALVENVPGARPLTVRERMEKHRATPSCNACHGIMDPMGLSLENFDAVGQWRDKDYDTATVIDASGKMADGTPVKGPDDLRKALMARPQQFVQTLTRNLMAYALGRTLDYHDMPTVRKIVRDAAADHDHFSAILLGIVASPAFQMRQVPVAPVGAQSDVKVTQLLETH